MKEKITKESNLLYAHLLPEVWESLGNLPRTGWTEEYHNVDNPETVQEHTLAVMDIAQHTDFGLNSDDCTTLVNMLEIHDWAEAKTGDIVLLNLQSTDNYADKKHIKYENEQKIMKIFCEPLGVQGKDILELWERVETGTDPIADLARQIDKYQAIEKALEYDLSQGTQAFKEFYDYSQANSLKERNDIIHPVLLEKLDLLMNNWKNSQKMV